uniref:Mitochondrial cardiolipin hydrolase n=1 Tax=Glossina austeni TaxID=7395 RepID=A0A1A9VH42_GLOAU
MWESATFRYFIYGGSLVLLSEIVYHSHRVIKNWYNRKSMEKELWALILTNELTLYCPAKHTNNGKCLNKINIIERGSLCSNPYCMDSNVQIIVDLLNATKYSIDLAMYMITSIPISEALAEASLRGVIVRVITEYSETASMRSQAVYLLRFGAAVRFNTQTSRNLMHHKFCVLDSPSTIKYLLKKRNMFDVKKSAEIDNISSVLMTGSLNWTMRGYSSNYENVLLTNQRQMIQKYSDEFQHMWELFAPKITSNSVKYNLI